MKSIINGVLALLLVAAAVSYCKNPPPPEPVPEVTFTFDHTWDGDSLGFDTTWFTNAAGNKVRVEALSYRIGHITLHREDGSTYDAGNYELIQANEPNRQLSFILKGIPAGKYTGLSFLVGVDSARNHTGAQEGALDPAKGLYWGWNTGYIFSIFEGRWLQGGSPEPVSYHVGTDAYLIKHKKLTLDNFSIEKNSKRVIHLSFNAAEIFKSPHTIDIPVDGAYTHTTDEPGLASKLKDNQEDCVTVKSIE